MLHLAVDPDVSHQEIASQHLADKVTANHRYRRGGCCRSVAGEESVCVVGEAGGRLCPRETHGRPWPCEWVARRHCVKRRGERQYVAKTRSERSGKRRDGAKRKLSEGSCLRLALVAVVQNRFGIYPLVEGPARHVHPKTTTFCLVLGFTPSRQPSRAHQSQNDLGQLYSGTSVVDVACRYP